MTQRSVNLDAPWARYPVISWVSDRSGNPEGWGYELRDSGCLWLRATFEPIVSSLRFDEKCVLRVPGTDRRRVRLPASYGFRLGAPSVDGYYMLMAGEYYLLFMYDSVNFAISTFDYLL